MHGLQYYPCSEWDDLMTETLADSVYKHMDDKIRTKNKGVSRGGRAGVKAKGPAFCGLVEDSDDEL